MCQNRFWCIWGNTSIFNSPNSACTMGFWRVIPSSQELEKLVPRSHRGKFPPMLPRSGNVRCCPQNEIYDIGTEILYFQCFVTTDMFLFSISIFMEDLETFRRDLAFGTIKTRFKAILKKIFFGLDSLVGICRGRRFPTKISFDICSKEVLTMRNRLFILPKPEKLNYHESLRF